MSDERRDDEILGRALARAIETIDVNETPYERSRIATAPAKRGWFGIWQVAGAAAAILLAVALGTWFMRPVEERPPVGSSPSVPPSASSPATTPGPAVATPPQDQIWVYFARIDLPPIGANVIGHFVSTSPESRIASRLTAVGTARASNQVPAGTYSLVSTAVVGSISVRVQGDVARVEFSVPNGWGVSGSAQSTALLQQLVYTITEEPGVRQALITENGRPATIDQLLIDKPLSREDVFGYTSAAKPDSIVDGGDDTVAEVVDWRASVDDVAPGLGRFVVELRPTGSASPRPYPEFEAKLEKTQDANEPAKWVIWLRLPDARWVQAPGEAFHCCPAKLIGKTPVRRVTAQPLSASDPNRGVTFAMYLDDARPWRVAILHNPLRVVVDVGGVPQATSDSVAVYAPRAGDTGRTVSISGFARAFEATVTWRIKNSRDQIVAEGFTTASIGTSPIWGSFQTTATIPANVSGNVTLEVFWPSPRDGEPMGLVQVPLTVR